MKKILIGVLVTGMVGLVQAGNWVPLSAQEAALMDATHVARVTFEDMAASTDTNTALVITNLHPFAAKDAVELVGMVLEQAFDTGNTNFTGSVLLTVGDSADADLYLASTELASDGSEVFFKYGRTDVPTLTVASTLTTNTLIGLDASTNVATNVIICVSAKPTATAAAGVLAQKVYTAADYLKLTFTPNLNEALSANTSGAVRLYFRVKQGGK
jgi:hypothetical protein